MSLAVSLALQPEGGPAMAPLADLAPYELPRPAGPETDFVLRLPLRSDATLRIGVAAFDQAGGRGCMLALGHAAHLYRTTIQDDVVTIALNTQREDVASGCPDAARIVAITPTTLAVSGNETLQVRGWGFAPGARIVLNGVVLETRYISGGLLEATVPPSPRYQQVPLEVAQPDGTTLRYTQLRYLARKLAFESQGELQLGGAYESEVADLDGDGRLDIVFYSDAFEDVVELKVALQRTPFKFDVTTLPCSNDLSSLRLRDMDRDGDIDIVAASLFDPMFDVYVNDGRGGFSRQRFSIGAAVSFVGSMHVVDLSGDGAPEVLLVDDSTKMYTFPNDGQGSFSVATRQDMALTASHYHTAVTSFDYDLDGRQDLVFLGSYHLAVLRNPTLPLPTTDTTVQEIMFETDLFETDVTGDIDGDAIPDLLFSDAAAGLVLLPSVGPQVRKPLEIAPSCVSFYVGAADIDGDGRVDLATACEGGGEIQILLQGEALRFALSDDALRLTDDIEFWSLRLADLDGDNKPDLIVSMSAGFNPDARKVYVFRNVSR